MSSDAGLKLQLDDEARDRALDEILARELAIADRPPDHVFVAKVDHAVAEWQRYRRWRADLWRNLAGEMVSIAALGGSLAVIAEVPEVRAALSESPTVAWPALLSILLFWLVVTRTVPRPLA
jgi:hypothetical protein